MKINIEIELSTIELDIIESLAQVRNSDDYESFFYNYSFFDNCNIDNLKQYKAGMKRLRLLNIVEFARGLMNDEGELFGAGHRLTLYGLEIYNSYLKSK